MIQSLLLIIIVVAIVYLIKYAGKLSPEKRKKFLLRYGLYALAFIGVALFVTGKLHWVAAVLAALLPIGQRLFGLAIRALPFLKYWQDKKQGGNTQGNGNSGDSGTTQYSGKMTVKQAKEILGMDTITNADDISKRHKELMQKNHPDRGGSDFLAAQINQAKDTLIKNLKA